MARTRLRDATVADFSGGWNVADSDLNLASNFQPVSDNVIRGVNGSIAVRWGNQLFADAEDGVKTTFGFTGGFTAITSGTEPIVQIDKVGHGLNDGDHITFVGVASTGGSFGDAPVAEFNQTHSVSKVNADTFQIALRTAPVAAEGTTFTVTSYSVDTHTLGGNIIHQQAFKGYMLLFTDIGEVGLMDQETGAIERIWDLPTALVANPGVPGWRHCDLVSSTTFKSSVIAVNGHDKDKPIQIDDEFNVDFLVDGATSVNTFVPRADFVLGMQGYVIMIRTDAVNGDPQLAFSALGTDGTFSGEALPQDAVDVDLSMITDTVEPTLLGAAALRDKMFVAFYDRGMLGTIGVYNEDGDHVPDFNDTIAENGTVSHRTMVSLGNDVFMCDYAGVPSVSISSQSGGFVPVRLSELIAPELQKHLASLSEDTLRNKAYAFFNKSDRMYTLMLPKYDEVSVGLPTDPFLFNPELKALNQAVCFVPGHKLFDQSNVVIAGAIAIGSLPAASINGTRSVVRVINEDSFVIQLDGAPAEQSTITGGGSVVTMTPVNDETIGYGFEYNKELRIRRWTRLRGMNFACAGVTQRGRVYFAKGLRVYRYGSSEEPLYADHISEYDYRVWQTSFDYEVGDRVYDSSNGTTYICMVEHTSAATGSFADYREDFVDIWEEYQGEPIVWAVETPWSDLDSRSAWKSVKYVKHDTEGTGQFDFSIFTNQIQFDPQTYALAPARTMQFSAGDVGGYGMLDPASWGAGRRTREEKLWPMPCRGTLFKLRWSGSTVDKVRVTSTTLLYLEGNVR